MASRRTSMSRASPALVQLSCSQCNNHLGTFENEWVRLTSSYARAKHDGRHMGTEIGDRIQEVPTGVTQKAAEGCGMAEIFCKECSNLVGQYCKSAPNAERQHLVDNYFYKLSRTHLTDSQTAQRIEPLFGYEGDLTMPPPRPSVRPTARPRISVRPPVLYTPRESLARFSDSDAGYRQSVDRYSLAEMREGSVVAERLSLLERRVSEYEADNVLRSRAGTPLVGFGYESLSGSQARSFSQHTSENESVIEDQRKQISVLTGQIETLNGTIQDLKSLVEDTRSEKQARLPAPAPVSAEPSKVVPMSSFEDMVAAMKRAHSEQSELSTLHEENKQLRAKFATLESAMGMKPGTISESTRTAVATTEASSHPVGGAVRALHSQSSTQSIEPGIQLPTPVASQQSSVSDEEVDRDLTTTSAQIGTTGTNAEPLMGTVGNLESEILDQPMETADKMKVNDDDYDQLGDDEIDELAVVQLSKFTKLPAQDAASVNEDHVVTADKSLPASKVEGNRGAPQYPDPEASVLKEVSTPEVGMASSAELLLARKQPAKQAMFGVIKPVSAKATKRSRKKAQAQAQSEVQAAALIEDPAPASTSTQIHLSASKAPLVPPSKPVDADLVEFSDDENPAPQPNAGPSEQSVPTASMQLHYGRGRRGPPKAPAMSPWVQETRAPIESDLQTHPSPPQNPSSPSIGALIGSEAIQINITHPEDIRQQLENKAKGIKVKDIRERKPPMQTTEKLLNEELLELGLDHWIGKEKNTKEYRQEIDQARAERRGRKKQEALAKAGVTGPAVAAPFPPPVPLKAKPTGKPGRPPRKYNTLQSLRRKHSRAAKATKPLADVTGQQNAQAASQSLRKRKADKIEDAEEAYENIENPPAQTKQAKKRVTGRKSQASLPELEKPTKIVEVGVQTRRQMRVSEVEKLDKLAQEAMEAETRT